MHNKCPLATPPKTVSGGEDRYFRIRRTPKGKVFFAHFLDANLRSPRQRFEPNGATLISHLAKDWMQHFPAVSVFDFGPWWMFRQQ